MSDFGTLLAGFCQICGKAKEGHNYHHEFVDVGQPITLVARDIRHNDDAPAHEGKPQGQVRIPTAGDPVLRMALLRKGIITVDDIEAVEAELKATGVAGHDPKTLG